MQRFFITLVLILLIGSMAAWIADHPGNVSLTWEGWRIDTSLAVLSALLALFSLALLALAGLIGWIRRETPLVGANRHLKNHQKGLDALNGAILALSLGNKNDANRLLRRAKRLLPPQPMLSVIAAQAAQMDGNEGGAKTEYLALRAHDDSALIGIRGLLQQALQAGRKHEALNLADEALALSSRCEWALSAKFDLLVQAAKWRDAESVLKKMARSNGTEKQENAQKSAVLSYNIGKELELAGDHDQAIERYQNVIRERPDFEPAVSSAARLYIVKKQAKKALKLLEAAWKLRPQRSYIAIFESIAPHETALERLSRFKAFAQQNPQHYEAKLARARYEIEAGHVGEASSLVAKLLNERDIPPSYRVKAQLLRAKGGAENEKEAAFLDKQAQTISEPLQYHCASCLHPHKSWTALCSHCGAFATLGLAQQHVLDNPSKRMPQHATPLKMITESHSPIQFEPVKDDKRDP